MSEPVRTFEPVPPSERPHRIRRTARILLRDTIGRVLLFEDSDPGIPGSHWWITPGGGVDPGETDVEAAVRELAEETGARVAAPEVRGPVAVRRVVHGYTDVVIDQVDAFFAVTVPPFDVDDAGHTEEERLTMTQHRWWTVQQLAATGEEIWPAELVAYLELADTWEPGVPARELPDVEESTVPDVAR